MATRNRKILTAAAAFFAFALSQVYVQAGLPNAPASTVVPQRVITATLKTKDNKPVKINGNDAGTGTTLLTNTTIETPDQVSAIIDLGEAGTVEVGPNTKIELSFDAEGNVHVKLTRGCSRVNKTTDGVGEADVATDTVTDATDPKKKQAGGCLLPNGQLGNFPSGLSGAQIGAISASVGVGVVTTAIIVDERGGNPSPSN
jgi:hypothetical protein